VSPAGIFAFRGLRLSILDGELAATLTDALIEADIPGALVIRRQETSGPPWDPVTSDVDYNCMGWIDDYDAASRAGSLVQQNDRKVFVVASTLVIAPIVTDRLVVGTTLYTIIGVQRDPAGACWVLQCRV